MYLVSSKHLTYSLVLKHYTQWLNFIIILVSKKVFNIFFYHMKVYQIKPYHSVLNTYIIYIIYVGLILRIVKYTFLTFYNL